MSDEKNKPSAKYWAEAVALIGGLFLVIWGSRACKQDKRLHECVQLQMKNGADVAICKKLYDQ